MTEQVPIQMLTPEQVRQEQAFRERLARAQGGTVQAMAAEGASLAEIAGNAAWFAEAMTQKHRHPQSAPVACKPGCAWCCHQAVALTVAEAARIARFVASNPGTAGETTARLRAVDAKTRGLGPLQRARLREPCAFLQEGRCQVYAARPLACAEFSSYDAEACKRGQDTGYLQGGVVHEKARLLAHQAVYEGLRAGLAAAFPKADTAPLELTAAVLAFLEDPTLENRWASGADLSACRYREADAAAG